MLCRRTKSMQPYVQLDAEHTSSLRRVYNRFNLEQYRYTQLPESDAGRLCKRVPRSAQCESLKCWWIWQNQDLEKRSKEAVGIITFPNKQPSRNGTLLDTLSLGSMFEDWFANITIADAMSTLGGPFCYIYM